MNFERSLDETEGPMPQDQPDGPLPQNQGSNDGFPTTETIHKERIGERERDSIESISERTNNVSDMQIIDGDAFEPELSSKSQGGR